MCIPWNKNVKIHTPLISLLAVCNLLNKQNNNKLYISTQNSKDKEKNYPPPQVYYIDSCFSGVIVISNSIKQMVGY